ncbi:restriction endonuclease fold toxin 5 domain-containing protein [Paraburkholderia sp.]|uniref:restriction endonuclease fold toxin 5 domain-containing protein n=1 Tax=Paraburkholderia sp. TaxID=1926495 RepID=UPI003D700A99
MAGALIPLLAGAAVELGPALSTIGTALLGGAAVAGTGSLAGDTTKPASDSKSKAEAVPRALPNSTKKCDQCPPEQTGRKLRVRHGVNWPAYQYQARITGYAFDTEACEWSDEWEWLGVDFDGFHAEECLLQEAKGDYDQFFNPKTGKPYRWFSGLVTIQEQIEVRATLVKANPPTRLMYYFQTPLTHAYFRSFLARRGVLSITTG